MRNIRVKTSAGNTFYKVRPRRRFRGRHLFIILLILGICFGAYRKVYRVRTKPSRQTPVIEATSPKTSDAAPGMLAAAPKPENSDPFEIRRVMVHIGDTLPGIAKDMGAPDSYPAEWNKACRSARFGLLKENDELIFFLNRADGLPAKIVFMRSGEVPYTLRKNSTGWECRTEEAADGASGKTVRGALSGNFYDSWLAGGLPAPVIAAMADIFSYDIDFTSDLKQGDSFSIFFQENPIQSSQEKQFLVLGAELNISGKVFQAFGYQLPDGSWDYYDSKGASLKRPFLKSPISCKALSSFKTSGDIKHFQKVSRPWLGIGYVVPRGTIVCSIGDGFISELRTEAGKSLSIEIRHRGGYSSWYGNLAVCSRRLRRGSPVSQGEMIGSAGSAGRGKSNVEFRFYKNGKPVNFQTAEFSSLKTIPKSIAREFEKTRDLCSTALRGEIRKDQKLDALSGRDS